MGSIGDDLLDFVGTRKFATILADPPWQFQNRTGKVAPEHKRLNRYATLKLADICSIPVGAITAEQAHLYLWVPNALLLDGLEVMKAWGFSYKTNLIWHKVRKDGGPDGRGVGFYFRNTTEIILFGVKGSMRTLPAGRSQVNIIRSQKQEHSRKPVEQYEIIESCSPPDYLELFGRGKRNGWSVWGNQAEEYEITWKTYKRNSHTEALNDVQPPLGLF
ncbi:MAG: MT-A70 family methyltransferase [Victivallales bacterium]|nr:MT-A70 family methyltransferase [Victivallales bacterium]